MTIEEKILTKLVPHAKRIQDGNGNDFDYLPAVLLQLMEEQKRQATKLGQTDVLLTTLNDSISEYKTATDQKLELLQTTAEGIQSTLTTASAQITVFADTHARQVILTSEALRAIANKIESLANATQQSNTRTTLQTSEGLRAIALKIEALANNALESDTGSKLQTSEGFSATAQQINSLANSSQQYNAKFTKFHIFGLVASTLIIGLAIAILQRY